MERFSPEENSIEYYPQIADAGELEDKRLTFEHLVKQWWLTRDDQEKATIRQTLTGYIRRGLISRDFLIDQLKKINTPEDELALWADVELHVDDILGALLSRAEALKGEEPAEPRPAGPEPERLEYPDLEIKKADQPPIIRIDEVLVPASRGPQFPSGSKEFLERHNTIPRSKYLMKLLADYGLDPQEYLVIEGRNEPKMYRRESYRMFVVPPLEKMVLVCDEENNATFIIHELTQNTRKYFSQTKDELRQQARLVETIEWFRGQDWDAGQVKENWEQKMLDALTRESPISGKDIDNQSLIEQIKGQLIFPEPGAREAALEFLRNKSGDELMEKNRSKLRAEFFDRPETTPDERKLTLLNFKDLVRQVRTEKGRKKYDMAPKKILDRVGGFLKALDDDRIRLIGTTMNELYDEYLKLPDLSETERDYDFNRFSSLVAGERRRRKLNAKIEFTGKDTVKKVKEFLSRLSDDEVRLIGVKPQALYDRLMSQPDLDEKVKAYSAARFASRLNYERTRRGLPPKMEKTSKPTMAKIHGFLEDLDQEVLVGEKDEEVYQRFILLPDLNPEERRYPLSRFRSILSRHRVRAKAKKTDEAA
jgi:hypothetical protein